MTVNLSDSLVRRAVRALALAPALLVLGGAGPAFATAPEQWGPEESVPALQGLLVFAVFPIGLFVLITLLVYIPSMARGQSYQPGLAWRSEPTWFGGPSRGLEATDEADPEAVEKGRDGRGGASVRW